MKKPLLITLGIIVGVIVLFFAFFGGTYNQLVTAEEGVNEAWAQVENVYQRRVDLVPNLVATVKGYAAHEKETLLGVVEARSKISKMNISSDVINDPNKFLWHDESALHLFRPVVFFPNEHEFHLKSASLLSE